MAYSRRKTYRRKAPKRTFKRKSYARKRQPLKKMIRREISRNIENKTSTYYNFDTLLYSVESPTFASANIFNVGPSTAFAPIINQGTSQSGRIGNRIKTKKLVIKGTFVPTRLNASTNSIPKPIQAKIWIMYDKTNPTTTPDPQGSGDFFQLGGTSTGFSDSLTDLWAPINTDRYRVLTTRTFKLGFQDYPASASAGNAMGYSNNDFKLNHNFSIDCTKYYPKDVRFNDNNALPTTRGLWMLVEYVACDGGAIAPGQIMMSMQYMVDYIFEDA